LFSHPCPASQQEGANEKIYKNKNKKYAKTGQMRDDVRRIVEILNKNKK
jgi:hypothetical protein